MSSSSTDRSEVNEMKVPELKPVSEWKKTPVAKFTEEEKNILSWNMDTLSKSFDNENNIVFWRTKYKELFVQHNEGTPMARDDMRQFRNVVMRSLSKRLYTSGFISAQVVGVNAPYIHELDKFSYDMDGLCKFFDVLNPTDTKNFNEKAAEEVWIKMQTNQMFPQLLTPVMKHLFPSVYKYKGQDGIFDDHIMDVIKKKSLPTDDWTGWEDHHLMISKVSEMWACMGCQTIIAIHLVDTVVGEFRSWWRNACNVQILQLKHAAEEEAKRKAEQAKALAAEFMDKFRQLDPAVRALVESQIQPSINPALIQALLPQLQQQITSPQTNVAQGSSSSNEKNRVTFNNITRDNNGVVMPTTGGSSSEKDGASSSSTITTTTTVTKKDAEVEDKLSLTDWISIDSTTLIQDADGFDRSDGYMMKRMYTYDEYILKRSGCTVRPKTKEEIILAHEARKKMNIKEYSFCDSEDEDNDDAAVQKLSDEEKEIEANGLVIIETPTKEKGTLEETLAYKFPKHREILDGKVKIKLKTYIEFETKRCGKWIGGNKESFTLEQIDHKDLCVEATVSLEKSKIPKSITSLNLKHEEWDTIFSEAAENYDINVEVDEKKDWRKEEKCHVYDLVTFEDPNSSHHGTKFYIIGMDVDALEAELLFVDTPLADNLEGVALKDLEHYEGDYPKEKSKSTTVGKIHGKTVATPSPLKNVDQRNILPGKRSRPPTNTFIAGAATNGAQKKQKKRMR